MLTNINVWWYDRKFKAITKFTSKTIRPSNSSIRSPFRLLGEKRNPFSSRDIALRNPKNFTVENWTFAISLFQAMYTGKSYSFWTIWMPMLYDAGWYKNKRWSLGKCFKDYFCIMKISFSLLFDHFIAFLMFSYDYFILMDCFYCNFYKRD